MPPTRASTGTPIGGWTSSGRCRCLPRLTCWLHVPPLSWRRCARCRSARFRAWCRGRRGRCRAALVQSRLVEYWIHGWDIRWARGLPHPFDDRAWWLADACVRHVPYALEKQGAVAGARIRVSLFGVAGGEWDRVRARERRRSLAAGLLRRAVQRRLTRFLDTHPRPFPLDPDHPRPRHRHHSRRRRRASRKDSSQRPATQGTVNDIYAVCCRYAPPAGSPGPLEPVPGSGALILVTQAHRFGRHHHHGQGRFIGYIAQLRTG
jgi:hypothetical protein